MKIVLDTNVLIAAFIARGVCSDLLEHCIQRHQLITSDFILEEFRERLLDKFNFNTQDVEKAVGLLQAKMQIVQPARLKSTVCRDPDDDMILATAISGKATCIVTGDKDLLVLKNFKTIEIVSPSEFAEYEERSA